MKKKLVPARVLMLYLEKEVLGWKWWYLKFDNHVTAGPGRVESVGYEVLFQDILYNLKSAH